MKEWIIINTKMIRKLTGKIEQVGDGFVVLVVNNVGYQIFLTEVTLGKLMKDNPGGEISIYIHTHVREDQLALYGFEDLQELELFELLISISGVGPKAALNILTIASPANIKSAVLKNDISILTKVSGIGKKTAERVVLELQSKIDKISCDEQSEAEVDQEVVEALMVMGYNVAEAREAVKQIPDEITNESEKIRFALKSMKK